MSNQVKSFVRRAQKIYSGLKIRIWHWFSGFETQTRFEASGDLWVEQVLKVVINIGLVKLSPPPPPLNNCLKLALG